MQKAWLYRRIFICTACLALLFPACGKQVGRVESELEVRLELPQGEIPELFWYGVERKELEARRGDESLGVWDWREEGRIEAELSVEDRLSFRGLDRAGRVLVEGAAVLSEEKKVSIPLRRVL